MHCVCAFPVICRHRGSMVVQQAKRRHLGSWDATVTARYFKMLRFKTNSPASLFTPICHDLFAANILPLQLKASCCRIMSKSKRNPEGDVMSWSLLFFTSNEIAAKPIFWNARSNLRLCENVSTHIYCRSPDQLRQYCVKRIQSCDALYHWCSSKVDEASRDEPRFAPNATWAAACL